MLYAIFCLFSYLDYHQSSTCMDQCSEMDLHVSIDKCIIRDVYVCICPWYYIIESIPLAGRHGDTQTNKPLNRDDWGFSKLLSSGV